jgi:ribulose kinase
MAAAAVRTHQQSRVESRESCQVKSLDAACSIFVRHTLVTERDGYYFEEEMDVEKLILLVKDHEAIFDASRCEHRNRDYIASIWLKIAQEMGVGKWSVSVFALIMAIFITTKTTTLTIVIMFLLLLGLIFNVFIRYFWCSK